MFVRSFFCPYCFNTIKAPELIFKDAKCGLPQERKISWHEKVGLTPAPRSVVCNMNKSDKCKKCSRIVTRRVCPKCNQQLPVDIDSLSDITIAVIGARGTGKSHFIALLINRIEEMYKEFDWILTPMTDQTISNYRENFYKPLFERKVTIESTQTRRSPEPLIYSLRIKKTNKRIMLVFFDGAGENFSMQQKIEEFNSYVRNASGIICLIDPLQLPLINSELKQRAKSVPDISTDAGDVLVSLCNTLYSSHSEKSWQTKGIPIPLAVAFSKMDAIKKSNVLRPGEYNDGGYLLDDDSDVYRESGSIHGVVNKSDVENISSSLEGWLHNQGAHNIFNATRNYRNVSYFGFSALGAPPQGSILSHRPTPIRVEDAFLWILAQNGLLKMK